MSKCFVISSSWYFIIVLTCLVAVVVQLLSFVWLCATPWTAVCQAFLSFTISWSLLKFTSIGLVSYLNISSPGTFLLMKYICICRCIFVYLWYYIYIWSIAIKMYSTNCFYLLLFFLLRCFFSYWLKKLFIYIIYTYIHIYIYIYIYIFRN